MNPDLGATSGAAEPSSSLPPLLPVVVDDAVPRSNGAEVGLMRFLLTSSHEAS